MRLYRNLKTIGGLVFAASVMLAQIAPPAPPAPITPFPPEMPQPAGPPQAPVAMIAPAAPMVLLTQEAPPAPPAAPAPQAPVAAPVPKPAPWPLVQIPPDLDLRIQDALDNVRIQIPDLDLQIERAQEAVANAQIGKGVGIGIGSGIGSGVDWQDYSDKVQKQVEKAQEAWEKAQEKMDAKGWNFASNYNFNMPMPKGLALQNRIIYSGGRGSDDSMYQNGLRAIDTHQYDTALSEFNNVVAHAGPRAEGGLYWKAYVLTKLGRAADAQAALDSLRKTYPNSRWLDDAKALELEVKQTKGPVSPDSENDEQIKVLALNGLIQNDPEKALPQVEKILKGSHSPSLKRRALYVLAQSNTPEAQKMLEQIARGANPDLQVRAIQYMNEKRNPNNSQILLDIYNSSNDIAVKRAVISAFTDNKDKDNLLKVLRAEKETGLRTNAINQLGDIDGQPELWQIYPSETTTEGKLVIINAMQRNGNLDKLADVARTDSDPKVRQKAIAIIATQEAGNPMATLAKLYTTEQDEKVKNTIVDYLGSRRGNCQALVDVAKSEKDVKMKLRIVERLSNMTKSCPAATDYLSELLSK